MKVDPSVMERIEKVGKMENFPNLIKRDSKSTPMHKKEKENEEKVKVISEVKKN